MSTPEAETDDEGVPRVILEPGQSGGRILLVGRPI